MHALHESHTAPHPAPGHAVSNGEPATGVPVLRLLWRKRMYGVLQIAQRHPVLLARMAGRAA